MVSLCKFCEHMDTNSNGIYCMLAEKVIINDICDSFKLESSLPIEEQSDFLFTVGGLFKNNKDLVFSNFNNFPLFGHADQEDKL